MSILGNRVLRKEDPKFLTDGGIYVDDLDLEGAPSVTYVRSTMASAAITRIDVSDAKAGTGRGRRVHRRRHRPRPAARRAWACSNQQMMPAVAGDRPCPLRRRAGRRDRRRDTARRRADAAELVFVDYEPDVDAVVDPEQPPRGETLLFPEAGTNTSLELAFGRNGRRFFDDCEVVVRQRMVNQRVAPCPLEVRAAAVAVGRRRPAHPVGEHAGRPRVKGDAAPSARARSEDESA